MTFTKWHHEWRRVSSKSHSWCHLVKVILYPQGREPLPQPHSQKCPPHWVETLLPCHHFRDSSQPRCTQNWHKTDETGCSGCVSFCDHPKFTDEGTSQFFVLDPILETLLPIFFTLWSSIQRQWPVRITSCTRHSQNAGNFFSPINHQRELCNLKAKGCNFEISTAHKMKNLWAVDWSKNNKIKVSGFCIPLTYFLDAISEQSSELTVVWTQGKI